MGKEILVQYTLSARKDLKRIEKNQAKKIVVIIAEYTKKKPLENAKSLSGIFQGLTDIELEIIELYSSTTRMVF